MALEKITRVAGRAVNVPGNDIDTDRIIPARFMKCVTFDGLGEFLFYDVRRNADGSEKPHPLNDRRFKGASILLSGVNFGCGSSREHAPQALQKFGNPCRDRRGVCGDLLRQFRHPGDALRDREPGRHREDRGGRG